MQTLLPYANFRLSAHVLDPVRLIRQQDHCVQVLRAVAGTSRSTAAEHPGVIIWREFGVALTVYSDCIIRECRARNLVALEVSPRSPEGTKKWGLPLNWATDPLVVPDWVGLEKFHASQRAALMAKREAWYSQFRWDERPHVSYFWPAPLPVAGEWVADPGGLAWLVMERDDDQLVCMRDGGRKRVPLREFRGRKWLRATRDDL